MDMDTDYDCRGVPGDGAPSATPPTKDNLRMIDSETGPHPPFWWVITPEGDEELCYINLENTWDGSAGSHVWTATVWNAQGYRAVYSEEEWSRARLEALVRPVRPQTEIQRVIMHSVEEDVITPRCGLELYEETLEQGRGSYEDHVEKNRPVAEIREAGEGRRHA